MQFEDDRGVTVGRSEQFCSVKEDSAGAHKSSAVPCMVSKVESSDADFN